MIINKTYKILLTIWVTIILGISGYSQIVCADVEIVPNTGLQTDMVFDSFNKYIAGITQHGIAKIKIKVDDQVPPNPDCKWMLTMSAENNPSSGAAADEWETLASYGTGNSNHPKIEILEVRVTNGCSTSPIDGVYNNFTLTGDFIEIIENTGIRIDAGSCVTNVNGPGNYLANYEEFNFQIDFRITPGLDTNPGIYQLQIKFELTEVP